MCEYFCTLRIAAGKGVALSKIQRDKTKDEERSGPTLSKTERVGHPRRFWLRKIAHEDWDGWRDEDEEKTGR
jgi:hypothetical protein